MFVSALDNHAAPAIESSPEEPSLNSSYPFCIVDLINYKPLSNQLEPYKPEPWNV